jgi:hypothetical protein
MMDSVLSTIGFSFLELFSWVAGRQAQWLMAQWLGSCQEQSA